VGHAARRRTANGALLEVRTDDGASLIAFDVLGSGVGERVLVATGSVASATSVRSTHDRRADHRIT